MAFCPNCGKEVTVGRFCTGCGTPIVQASVTPPACEPNPEFEPQTQSIPQEAPSPTPQAAPVFQPQTFPSAPQPKKMNNKRWFLIDGIALAVVAIAVILIVFVFGGNSSAAGTYTLSSMEASGMSMNADTLALFGMEITMVLREDGTGVMNMMGYTEPLTWTDSSITVDGDTVPFTLDGDTLSISIDGSSMIFTRTGDAPASGNDVAAADSDAFADLFGDDETVAATVSTDGWEELPTDPDEPEYTESTEVTAVLDAAADYWNNSWYGWWISYNCDGDYVDWENYWWDCCANTTLSSDRTMVSIDLWDEDFPASNPLLDGDLYYADWIDTLGAASGASGNFMDAALADCTIYADPLSSDYDNLLTITGHYTDPVGTGGFDFTIYLRPWGILWDDWYEDDDSCLPYYYSNWYLPLLEEGYISAPVDLLIGSLS